MKPLHSYPLLSDQVSYTEVAVIVRELAGALHASDRTTTAPAVVEFGCYVGTTSVFIQRLLREQSPSSHFHVYDSFAGLPEKTAADHSAAGDQFRAGELNAAKTTFIRNFKQAGLPLPVIHKGWFDSLQPTDVPDAICFAFLDGDYYASIATSLQLIAPKLLPNAVIVVDDYQSSALPGATKAVDEWLRNHPEWTVRHEQSLAILKHHWTIHKHARLHP